MFARCKQGTMRVSLEGEEYTLTTDWLEVPQSLAEDIAPHINVEVSEKRPSATQETKADPAPPSSTEGSPRVGEPHSGSIRRSGSASSEKKSG